MTGFFKQHRFHLLLLLLWILIGAGLRFAQLSSKPLWTDEFSTIVFSLGNSFRTIPLNQVINTDQLLQPLRSAGASVGDVITNLLQESNHPPLFFVLNHFWMSLFPSPSGYVSIAEARSLSALLGVATIPATFALGWLAFGSRGVGQLAAALMAVSPFGIYLSQEARHYTLALIWIIASLGCLILAGRSIRDRTPLVWHICLLWIVINGLGVASHYLFLLTLGAIAIAIGCLSLGQSWQERGVWHPSTHWQRIWVVAAGTVASSIVWFPFLTGIQDSELTRWIYRGDRSGLAWLDPIAQLIAGWVTMLYMLPIQSASQVVVILSAVALLLLIIWTVPKLYWGLRVQSLVRDPRLSVLMLGGFVAGALLLFLGITYFAGMDLTSAFRYNFVYFPAVIVLAAAGLASCWNLPTQIAQAKATEVPIPLLSLLRTTGKRTILMIWLLSLLGGWVVIANLGYQKTHRPDLVAEAIRQETQGTALIAIPHYTHGQTGRLMGIAWALQSPTQPAPSLAVRPQYLLARYNQDARLLLTTLRQAIARFNRPFDLWLINFQDVPEEPLQLFLDRQNCLIQGSPQRVDGYQYQRLVCAARDRQASAD